MPIFKSGDAKDPANYRPIALINTLIKLYELTILQAIGDRNQITSVT